MSDSGNSSRRSAHKTGRFPVHCIQLLYIFPCCRIFFWFCSVTASHLRETRNRWAWCMVSCSVLCVVESCRRRRRRGTEEFRISLFLSLSLSCKLLDLCFFFFLGTPKRTHLASRVIAPLALHKWILLYTTQPWSRYTMGHTQKVFPSYRILFFLRAVGCEVELGDIPQWWLPVVLLLCRRCRSGASNAPGGTKLSRFDGLSIFYYGKQKYAITSWTAESRFLP